MAYWLCFESRRDLEYARDETSIKYQYRPREIQFEFLMGVLT